MNAAQGPSPAAPRVTHWSHMCGSAPASRYICSAAVSRATMLATTSAWMMEVQDLRLHGGGGGRSTGGEKGGG